MGNDYYVYFVVGSVIVNGNKLTGEIYTETYILKLNSDEDRNEGLRKHLGLNQSEDIRILRSEILGDCEIVRLIFK